MVAIWFLGQPKNIINLILILYCSQIQVYSIESNMILMYVKMF